MEDILISLDTEFESSNIIEGNCLQLAFVAFLRQPSTVEDDSWIVDKLSICFKDQGKKKEPACMKFWETCPTVYDRIQAEAEDLLLQMNKLQNWLNDLSLKYKIYNFVSDHSCVDFAWFRNLFLTHCDMSKNKFNLPFKCICINGMLHAMELMGYTKDEINKYCTTERYQHTHYALDDAIEGAYYYLKLSEFIRMI
jgi:hypothetical protein